MGISENNLKLILAFIERSNADIDSAGSLLKSGNYADSAYHSQQAAEKIAKCALIAGNKFVRSHVISGVFQAVANKEDEKWKKELSAVNKQILDLEQHWIRPRYPEAENGEIWNPLKEYRQKDAEQALKKAKEVSSKLLIYLEQKFGIKYPDKKK